MDTRLLELSLTSYLKAAFELLLPRTCVVCGRPLALGEEHICLVCDMDFPYTHFELCSHNKMADYYNERLCEKTEDEYIPYQWAIALMSYHSGSDYSRIPWALKYNSDISCGRYFSKRLAEKIRSAPWLEDVDLIVPVPAHKIRRYKRGYNQAEVIARELGLRLGVKVEPHLLIKSRYTRSQVKVGTSYRKANIKDSFRLSKGRVREVLNGASHILLVDDVFTTGSTLSECYKTIRTALDGTVRISIATLACVE